MLRYEASNRLEAWCEHAHVGPDRLIDGGWTELTLAAELGEEEVVHQLIEEGAGVDVPDDSGRVPLMRAVLQGSEPVARALIDAGASMHMLSSDGSSPLQVAIELGRESMVSLLLNASARNHGVAHATAVATRSHVAAAQASTAADLLALPGSLGSREVAVAQDRAWERALQAEGATNAVARTGVARHARTGAAPSVGGVHGDRDWVVRHLLLQGTTLGLAEARQRAEQRGYAQVAAQLRHAEARPHFGAQPWRFHGDGHGGPPAAMVRAVEADLLAIEVPPACLDRTPTAPPRPPPQWDPDWASLEAPFAFLNGTLIGLLGLHPAPPTIRPAPSSPSRNLTNLTLLALAHALCDLLPE